MTRTELRCARTRNISECGCLVVFALLCGAVACDAGSRQNTPAVGTSANVAQAVRADRPPRLDGTLDDPIWKDAEPIADFLQQEPYQGRRATERTVVRILYTQTEIYFGIEIGRASCRVRV